MILSTTSAFNFAIEKAAISFDALSAPTNIYAASGSQSDTLPDYFHDFGRLFADWWNNVVLFGRSSHGLNEWLLIALSVLAIFCIFRLLGTLKKSITDIRNASLLSIFIFTWIYGILVYDIGMYTGPNFSLLTNLPLSILLGFKIFLLDNNVSVIHQAFHDNWLYFGNFALVHFLAACVTALFVIKHFGYNMIARFKMWKAGSFFSHKVDEIFVFWGLNSSTLYLTESINKKFEGREKDYHIVIVRTNHDDDDSPEDRTRLNRMLDFLSMKNSELDKIQETGSLSISTYADISLIDKDASQKSSGKILAQILRLKPLTRILRKKVRNKIHMFFLSDNENENLHAVSLLKSDMTLRDFAFSGNGADNESETQVIFYCHARYNSVHRVIEDTNPSEKISVKVIDSSHISIEMLKRNNDVLPVNFVDVEADATVSSPFNALVVGFSEMGLDTVRFLYEFGAFVKTGSTDTNVLRSDFHLDVVDKQMDDRAGIFVTNAPSIKPSIPYISGGDNPDALITLHQMDCRSVEFYLQMEKWVEKLNYVVLATEDAELNISLGVRIFKAALRYRKDMHNFCILVRAQNDDGYLSRIAQHYNRLWLAQEAVKDVDGTGYHQETVTASTPAILPIYLFGQEDKIYTYENIIDDSLQKKAIEFKERYVRSATPAYLTPSAEKDKAWHREFRDRMQLEGRYKGFYPSFSGLSGIRRKQGQDVANCLHAVTKLILVQKAFEKAGIDKFDWATLTRRFETITYSSANGEQIDPLVLRILDVLAQTEHLRWSTSHEILGYIGVGEPNSRHEVKMHHSCITAWENLSTATQSYDYNVVDVTLGIITPERPLKQ